ncbi:hypothetical protein DDE82_009160 [Stemphylium lycopersici]|nr:hypothetical protein DDE82_009160 [Stemphylium lycopersici]
MARSLGLLQEPDGNDATPRSPPGYGTVTTRHRSPTDDSEDPHIERAPRTTCSSAMGLPVYPASHIRANDMPLASAAKDKEQRHNAGVNNNYSVGSSTTRGSSCAYPSWPVGRSLDDRSAPSSCNSDAELRDESLDDVLAYPFLKHAPAPPRVPLIAQTAPILPPLLAQKKPKSKRRRRSSGRNQPRAPKPMTPIVESLEPVE